MNDAKSPIRNNGSVKVFGSSIVRVTPDTALIVIAVSRLEKQPKDAFANARRGAQAVHGYLQLAGVKEFGSSRVTLSQESRYTNGQNRFVGYQAKIGYSIVLRNLDRVEEILTGLIDAGANELTSVTFQTTRLKEVRADARRRAVAAAREKAELYCASAGVSVGRVVALEDANPEALSGRSESYVSKEPVVDDPGELKAIDPGAITVGAAVNVLFEIEYLAGHSASGG
jgi:uncharacterized protein YggE